MRQSSLPLLALLLLAPPPLPPSAMPLFSGRSSQPALLFADAFAEWTKCWTELEEGEIIMNQPVAAQKAAINVDGHTSTGVVDENDDSVFVRLMAMDTNGREVKPIHVEGDCDASMNKAQDSQSQGDEAAEADDETCHSQSNAAIPYAPGQTFHIKMASVITHEGQSYPPERTQYLAETTDGGQFLGRSAMCDGNKRAVARKRDDVVRIKLSGEQNVVRVWAGYASDKAAVILTPKLVFRLDPSGGGQGGNGKRAPATSPAPAPAPAPSPTPSVPSQPVTAPVMPPDL